VPATVVVLPFLLNKIGTRRCRFTLSKGEFITNYLGSLQGVKTVQNKNSVGNREKQEAA